MIFNSALPCIAYTVTGDVCRQPATAIDPYRGGPVCRQHDPGNGADLHRRHADRAEHAAPREVCFTCDKAYGAVVEAAPWCRSAGHDVRPA